MAREYVGFGEELEAQDLAAHVTLCAVRYKELRTKLSFLEKMLWILALLILVSGDLPENLGKIMSFPLSLF